MVANKTFKREYSAILLAILVHQIYIGNTGMVEIIAWPILSFVATAAGIHIYGRNTINQPQQQQRGQE